MVFTYFIFDAKIADSSHKIVPIKISNIQKLKTLNSENLNKIYQVTKPRTFASSFISNWSGFSSFHLFKVELRDRIIAIPTGVGLPSFTGGSLEASQKNVAL